MNRWFRLYDEILDDPKVQRLSGDMFKTWINLLCLANRNGGAFPDAADIAFALRIAEDTLYDRLKYLETVGLIESGDVLRPHNWDKRQFKSDADPTAAERQRIKRDRDKGKPVTRDMSVTSRPPEAETESEQKQSRAEQSADAGRAAACVEIGQRITDAMGVTNDPRWVGNWSIVSVWLSQGFDADLDIMPTVLSMIDRLRRGGKQMPGSLKYFSKAIDENHRARLASGESPAQRETREFYCARKGTQQHRSWLEHYRKQGRKMAFYETQDILTVPNEWPPTLDTGKDAA